MGRAQWAMVVVVLVLVGERVVSERMESTSRASPGDRRIRERPSQTMRSQ